MGSIHDGCKPDTVFSGRPNIQTSVLTVAHKAAQLLTAVIAVSTPKAGCIMENKLVIPNLKPVGSAAPAELVWQAVDLFSALMALPNLTALLVLSPQVLESLREYLWENR